MERKTYEVKWEYSENIGVGVVKHSGEGHVPATSPMTAATLMREELYRENGWSKKKIRITTCRATE